MSRFRDEIAEQPGIAAGMLSAGRGKVDSVGARIKEACPRGFVIAARRNSAHQPVVGIDAGLPEDLTPLMLAVLGQGRGHRVAVGRGIDPDRPRALNKVTRTW